MNKLSNFLPLLLLLAGVACNLEKVEPGDGPVAPFSTHFSLGSNQIVIVRSVAEAIDGGFIVSGYSVNTNATIKTIFVVKTSVSGSVEKVKTDFDLLGNATGGRLIRTADNFYVLVGTEDTGSDYRIVVVKLKPDLTIVWNKTFTSGIAANKETGYSLVETGDGHYLVAGGSSDGSNADPYFIKVRADNGTESQHALIDNSNPGVFLPWGITRNGNNYGVFGYNLGVSIPPPFFIKLDQNLNALIYKNLNDLGNAFGDIVPNSSDGFAIASGVSSQLLQEAYMLNLTGNGDESRFDMFTTAASGGCYALSRSSTGQFVPAGWISQSNGGNAIAAAALVSPDFSTQFTYIHAEAPSSFQASAPVSDGGFVFAGSFGDSDVLLVKLNKELKLN